MRALLQELGLVIVRENDGREGASMSSFRCDDARRGRREGLHTGSGRPHGAHNAGPLHGQDAQDAAQGKNFRRLSPQCARARRPSRLIRCERGPARRLRRAASLGRAHARTRSRRIQSEDGVAIANASRSMARLFSTWHNRLPATCGGGWASISDLRAATSGIAEIMRPASPPQSPLTVVAGDRDDRLKLEGALDIRTLAQAEQSLAQWRKSAPPMSSISAI